MKMTRYLLSSFETKKYDQNTIERIGIPGMVLMERAALGTYDALRERGLVQNGVHAFLLAGYGNNGGDGLALARLLSEAGMLVEVCAVGKEEKATDSWRAQYGILQHYPVEFCNQPSHEEYAVVIDALFGVGLSRTITGVYEKAIETLNSLKGFKVALDMPSGISSDTGEVLGTAFLADLTVTYGFEKRGLYLFPGYGYCGEIKLAEMGISQRAFFDETPQMFCLDAGFDELLPSRTPSGNKGTFGKALILAGSYQMAGAAVLCAKACYSAGAGMVKVLTCEENRVILQETVPEALLGTLSDVKESLIWCSVVCVGPGLGKNDEALEAFLYVLQNSDKPLIVDADGLNMLAENDLLIKELKAQGKKGRTILLTPHLMELCRIYQGIFPEEGCERAALLEKIKHKPWAYAEKIAEELSVILIAKDARSFVCMEGKPICVNLSGNSGMGTAGSGDVLAGFLTAFLCQMQDAFEAACSAVRFHGLSGDRAKMRHGEHGMTAGDLIEAVRSRKDQPKSFETYN